jgi:hypothetical protein
MAYSGSTASSSLANPPIQIARGLGGGVNTTSTAGTGSGLWMYNSTNQSSEMTATGYFTDAYALGMRSGDVMIAQTCTGSSVSVAMGVMVVVSSSAGNFASTGAIVSSTR